MAPLLTQKYKNQYILLLLFILINSMDIVSSKCWFDYIHKLIGEEENNALTVVDVPIPKEPEVCLLKNDPKHHLEDFGGECPSIKIKEPVIPDDEPKIEHLDENKNFLSWQKIVEQYVSPFSFKASVIVIFAIPIIISIIFIVSHRLYVKEVRSLMSNLDDVISKLNEPRDAVNTISSHNDDCETEMETLKANSSIERLKDVKLLSEKILLRFQKMANKLHSQEVEQYLSTEFLQLLAEYYVQNDTLEFDYLRRLTPENLLQLGKFRQHYMPLIARGDNRTNTRVNVVMIIDGHAPNTSMMEETDMLVTSELKIKNRLHKYATEEKLKDVYEVQRICY